MHFVVSVACGYKTGHHETGNRSMFIHPDRVHESHEQYMRWINALKIKWEGELKTDKNADEYKDVINYIKETLEAIRNNADEKDEIPKFNEDFIELVKQSLNKIIPMKFIVPVIKSKIS